MTDKDWISLVAEDIRKEFPLTEESLREIIYKHHPGGDWMMKAAEELASHFSFGRGADSYVTDEQRQNVANNYLEIIIRHWYNPPPVKEPPLLQCSECHNTESCAGAMARAWNHGRCQFCAGYFKVVRA